MNLIVLKVAFRNIFLHKMKTLIVGSILIFGSFLSVLGNSIVDAISQGMKNSITQSVTGDIQIYSEDAKESLSVFGNMDGSPSDVGFVKNFKNIKEKLSSIENIQAIVPMGSSSALLNPGNNIDVQVAKLRTYYKKISQSNEVISTHPELLNLKNHLKMLISELKKDVEQNRTNALLLPTDESSNSKVYIENAMSEGFWKDFDSNYEEKLEFISNKIAPLIADDNLLYFGYIGTDPDLFKENFPQFEIVKGEMIPKGEKGFLVHDYIYENFVKNRIARRFDHIQKELAEYNKKISDNKELQDQIKASKEQIAEIYLTVPPLETSKIITNLQTLLNSTITDFRELLILFLDLNDENFKTRYDFFYKEIAPYIQLYKIKIGEVVPLSAFTKLGTSNAQNVKVWGTFRFKSFENSPLAGNFSIVDMTSFRELYGFLTESRKKQSLEIEKEMGIVDLSKTDMESMFGNEEPKLQKNEDNLNATPEQTDIDDSLTAAATTVTESETADVFINASIILKNKNLLDETISKIKDISSNEALKIKVVSWQEASGLVGQMTLALKMILFIFVFILFVIASVMIMNSLLMATMDRQQEIGTMRAIGAPKSFIYRAFLFESLLSGLLFAGIGSALAILVILTFGKQGIPAQGDVAKFFFSGSRLFFHVNWSAIFSVNLLILIISFIATQFPAWKAMKISPLLAMQKKD